MPAIIVDVNVCMTVTLLSVYSNTVIKMTSAYHITYCLPTGLDTNVNGTEIPGISELRDRNKVSECKRIYCLSGR